MRGLTPESAFLRTVLNEAETEKAYEPIITDEAEGESAVLRTLFG